MKYVLLFGFFVHAHNYSVCLNSDTDATCFANKTKAQAQTISRFINHVAGDGAAYVVKTPKDIQRELRQHKQTLGDQPQQPVEKPVL